MPNTNIRAAIAFNRELEKGYTNKIKRTANEKNSYKLTNIAVSFSFQPISLLYFLWISNASSSKQYT